MLKRFSSSAFYIYKQREKNICINKLQILSAFCTNANTETVECMYPEGQKDQILKMLNESDETILSSYAIRRTYAKRIIAYRNVFGAYKSVEDLLLISGISNDILEKFCKSIVEGKQKVANKTKKTRGSLTTTPVPEELKNADTTLGIHMCLDTVTWALLSHNYKLLEWNCYNVSESAFNGNILNIINTGFEICNKLPVSDIYVMENICGPKSNRPNYSKLDLMQQQLLVSLMTSITMRSNMNQKEASETTDFQSEQSTNNSYHEFSNKIPFSLPAQNLFILRPHVVARCFGLLVGNEIVSSQSIVEKLYTNSVNKDENNMDLPHVYVDDEQKYKYSKMSAEQKEQMNLALLKVLAFVDMSIHKNVISVNSSS